MRADQVQEIEGILRSMAIFLRYKLGPIVQRSSNFDPDRDCRELLENIEALRSFGFYFSAAQFKLFEEMLERIQDRFNAFIAVLREAAKLKKIKPGGDEAEMLKKANASLHEIHDHFLIAGRTFLAALRQPDPDESIAKRNLSIFICYRRSDTSWIVDRIYRYLSNRYIGVFRDLDSIPLGQSFPQFVKSALSGADFILVVVGPTWLTKSKGNRLRLSNRQDHVRIEIETALLSSAKTIPVLLYPATMPTASTLPKSIRRITELNGLNVRPDPDFENDMERLCRHLE